MDLPVELYGKAWCTIALGVASCVIDVTHQILNGPCWANESIVTIFTGIVEAICFCSITALLLSRVYDIISCQCQSSVDHYQCVHYWYVIVLASIFINLLVLARSIYALATMQEDVKYFVLSSRFGFDCERTAIVMILCGCVTIVCGIYLWRRARHTISTVVALAGDIE
jgi:hypothetical protein